MDRKTLWIGWLYGSEGFVDRKTLWIGRLCGSKDSVDRKALWIGRLCGQEDSTDRKARRIGRLPDRMLDQSGIVQLNCLVCRSLLLAWLCRPGISHTTGKARPPSGGDNKNLTKSILGRSLGMAIFVNGFLPDRMKPNFPELVENMVSLISLSLSLSLSLSTPQHLSYVKYEFSILAPPSNCHTKYDLNSCEHNFFEDKLSEPRFIGLTTYSHE